MLPLNVIDPNSGQINNVQQLSQNLQKLKSIGVDGVMSDVWWGIVEKRGPKNYNWGPYLDLVELVANHSLRFQAVMSFHQCGGNVGDDCNIPLPPWVLSVGNSNPNIFYRDQQGGADAEYLSWGVDNQTLFNGRTAVQMYSDFMSSFANTFQEYMPNVLNQVQVGLGPSGEMRYPSYQSYKWNYCGIGEFQCYDKYMLSDLQYSASAIGHSDWGNAGPNNAGTYNSRPEDTGFFSDNGGDDYDSPYGKFFLNWYSSRLIQHGDAILSEAYSIFNPQGVSIAAKISGIHWWYNSGSHAAENTAGYFNTDNNNAYLEIAQMFAKYNAVFDFTALEMQDSNNNCGSAPEQLVKQTILASQQAGIPFGGENALELCNPNCYGGGFDEIVAESTQYGAIHQFTYLRMNPNMFSPQSNLNTFAYFVQRMNNA